MKVSTTNILYTIVGLALAFALSLASADPLLLEVNCPDSGVCREQTTGMPLKVLPRALSHVYKSKDDSSDNILAENIKAFYPLYAFAREEIDLSDPANPKGWYKVGESVTGNPLGWMKAKDIVEWKQALIVSYTHPGEGEEARKRVLMFQNLDQLRNMVEAPDMADRAKVIYQDIENGKIPAGVVSKEPEKFVDITEKFYILPIIQFETFEIDGDEARLLQLAAAVPGQRSNDDTFRNDQFRTDVEESGELDQLIAGGKLQQGELIEAIEEMGVDVVFVMDMTGSMQPYLDSTKAAIKDIARKISQKGGDKIRFGLVGYRDDVTKMPRLEFTSKTFTEELVGADDLVGILDAEAKAARVGSKDYPEEVYAGVATGLASHWNSNALRMLILVGDASSHPVGHSQNTTGLDAETLRIQANDAQIHILAIHLADARATKDHAIAEQQYATLSRIRGTEDESALITINVNDKNAFEQAVKQAAEQVVTLIDTLQGAISSTSMGTPPAQTPTATPSAGTPSTDADKTDVAQQAGTKMKKLINTALVEYLGKVGGKPPKDIIVWALDRDPTDPAIRTLEVRVLLNKQQLSDLVQHMEVVLQAMKRAELTQMAFFDALASTAAGVSKDPDQIRNADKLKGAGLLDAFIESLPYKSDILTMSNEMYASLTPTERSELQRGVEAKLELYRRVNEDVDHWVRLNDSDADVKKVYPLSLDALP